MNDIARLDPQWEQVGIRGWTGYGNGVRFHIVGEEGEYFVSLYHTPDGYGLHVRHVFPSLRSAQRFCERYFG